MNQLDFILMAIAIAMFLIACACAKDMLPAQTRKWLYRIGPECITDAIERAGAIAELSPDERRKQAVIYLQELCIKNFGFPCPTSIANLLVEQVYQQWKRSRS